MLKSTIVEDLLADFDDSGDTDQQALVEKWVDYCLIRIYSLYGWTFKRAIWQFSTVANEDTIEIINAGEVAQRILAIRRVDTHEPLEETTFASLSSRGINFEEIGRPYAWFIKEFVDGGPIIQLVNVPDAIYVLNVLVEKQPKSTFASNEEIPIPTDLIPVLLDGVLSRMYLHEEKIEMSREYRAMFNEGLEKFKWLSRYPINIMFPQNSDIPAPNMPFLRFPDNF